MLDNFGGDILDNVQGFGPQRGKMQSDPYIVTDREPGFR